MINLVKLFLQLDSSLFQPLSTCPPLSMVEEEALRCSHMLGGDFFPFSRGICYRNKTTVGHWERSLGPNLLIREAGSEGSTSFEAKSWSVVKVVFEDS